MKLTLLRTLSTLSVLFLTKVLAESSKQILNIDYDATNPGPTVYEVEDNTLVNINFKNLNTEACASYVKSQMSVFTSTFDDWTVTDNNTGWGVTDNSGRYSGNFADSFDSSKLVCRWVFRNAEVLSNKDFITYLNYTNDQTNEITSFHFEISNTTEKDVFPLLAFAMTDHAETSMMFFPKYYTYYGTVAIQLKRVGELNVDFGDVNERETEIKEINVVKDDVVEVTIEKITKLSSSYTSFDWYLENADEIQSSNIIEPLNLIENGRSADLKISYTNTTTGRLYEDDRKAFNAFKFKITGDDSSAMTLSFILADRVDHVPTARVEVILYMNGHDMKIDMKELEYTVSRDKKNQVVEVENNSIVTIHVKNASDLCNSQENSECEWYFVKGDLDYYAYMDYLGSTYSKEKDVYDFKFKFENLTVADVLPNLEFSYGPVSQSRSETTPVDSLDSIVVHFANVGQIDIAFDYSIYDFMQEPIRADLYVKQNSIVQIRLSNICFSTNGVNYHWYLSKFTEDDDVAPLNVNEYNQANGRIKENQFPLPPGSCADEVFKFRVKGRASDTLPILTFINHEDGKMDNLQYVYVNLKLNTEEEKEKELDVYYENGKTVYDIEEGSYFLNVHVKNLSKDDCSALLANAGEGESENNAQCEWRFNNVNLYNGAQPRYYFLDYRGRTYDQATNDFIFKFEVRDLHFRFFPYIFFYYGPSNRNFNDKNSDKYFKPLRLHFAIPGQREYKFEDLKANNNEIMVQRNDVVHVIFNYTPENDWTLTNFNNADGSMTINVFDNEIVDTNPFWAKECCEEHIYSFAVKDNATAENLPTLSIAYLKVKGASIQFLENEKIVFKYKEGKEEVKKEEVNVQEKGKNEEEEEKKKQEKKNEKKEEEDQCMKDVGYPCCQKTSDVAYTDSNGNWGIEDDHWCVLTISMGTCQPIDGYPICTSTRTAVYVDSLQWGIENDEWCVICA